MSTMNLLREWRSIATVNGNVDVYVVAPVDGACRAIVMLPEIFGVNQAMRQKAERFAAEGFSVAVPDIFWRQQRRVDLGYSEDERKRGFELLGGYDFPQGVSDLVALTRGIEKLPEFIGPASLVGFCLGGKLALLVGAKTGAPVIISFYGVKLDQNLDVIKAYPGIFQFHVGKEDEHIPAETIAAVKAAVTGKSDAKVFEYEAAGHGFFNPGRSEIFAPAAAETAFDAALTALHAAS
jgi:carboxymethylenebutenolidase